MADPTTLLEYAQRRLDLAKAEQAQAQTRLDAIHPDAPNPREVHGQAIKKLQDLQKQEADVRKRLPDIPTSGDGDALVKELELTIIAARGAQAEVLDTAAALAVAEAEQTRVAAALGQALRAVADAQAALQSATDRNVRQTALTKALAEPALAGIQAKAVAAKTEDPFTKAQQRIDADFQTTVQDLADLLKHARSRLVKVSGELDGAAQAQADAEAKASDARVAAGLVAESAPLWVALQRADGTVNTYVATAQERYDRAIAKLKRIASADPLTDVETQQIKSLAANAKAQIDTEAKAFDLAGSVTALNTTLDQCRLDAMAKGIDPELFLSLRDAVRQVQAALDAAEDAVTQAQKDVDDAVSKATANGAVPDTDPDVIKKRSDLALATKARDDAKDPVAAKQKALDDAKVAAGSDPVIDALLTADDALKKAEGDVGTSQSAWDAKETSWHAAEKTLNAAQAKLADAIQTARKKNVDPETDGDVQQARLDVKTGQSGLDDAEQKYRDDGKGKLHIWEVAIPDGEWQLLADLEEATGLLDDLAAAPAALITAQTNAEKALVTALITDDELKRKAALLAVEAQARAARLEALARDRAARLLAALRGDR